MPDNLIIVDVYNSEKKNIQIGATFLGTGVMYVPTISDHFSCEK